MRKKMLKRAAVAGVVSAAVAGIAVASGGVAQAASPGPGKIRVCNGPDFFISVNFPDRGGLEIMPGVPADGSGPGCVTATLNGSANERIDVFVAGGQYLGSSIYNGTRGAEVRGIAGPGFVVS